MLKDSFEVTAGTGDCILEGSHHVAKLNLNDRFNLDVKIVFTWTEAPRPSMTIDGRIAVEVSRGRLGVEERRKE